ncbi:hypothetical protein [Halorubrum vacuolatum]|uniref:Uncharacterized protein n=1 Tax=Halorubrum vacuolatum TaxID=63740 RepID=A0A238XE39_HALVU|nr:hypothetical protein [Halorubrum vacuolatum]SNR56932.1 hypothetical protein SAMN06264855_11635 [Halorubrum vacuolatum]
MTRSLTADELVDATTEELATYLRSGAINTRALAESLDYEGLDIDDWARLKRIHFCLSEDVHEFIAKLPERVRRIKTENQRQHVNTQGEVRGSINWSGTLRTWADTGYADRSRFVCDTPYTEYDIAENRVLKRLLWHIHRTVTTDLRGVKYDWRRQYWTGNQIDRFDRLYKHNVHLNRIAAGQQITVTDQDLTAARRSRLDLYTDAYELLDRYQRLQADRFDPDITKLLTETLIIPASEPTLFELFCIFRILRYLNDETTGVQLHPIAGETTALAQLETDDRRIEVYHDQNGAIDFHETLNPEIVPEHSTFRRYQDALVDYTDALRGLTGAEKDPVLYRGRPDIVIEIYDTSSSNDELVAVLIGEVKYSSRAQTFRQGLEELATYRRFAHYDGYIVDNPNVPITSLLITNGYSTDGIADDITHLNGGDLRTADVAVLRSFATNLLTSTPTIGS